MESSANMNNNTLKFSTKTQKMLLVLFGVFLVLFGLLLIGLTTPVNRSFALDGEAKTDGKIIFSAEVPSTISIPAIRNDTGDAISTLKINLTKGGGLMTNHLNVYVTTTNISGYKLTMASNSTDTSLVNSASPTSATHKIASNLSKGTASGSFPADNWGYSRNSGSTFNPIPAKGSAEEIDSWNEPVTGRITRVDFGAKVGDSKAEGDFSNVVVFTAIADIAPRAVLGYNTNGGQGGPAPTEKSGSLPMTISIDATSIPTRDGFTFLGYARSSSATSPDFAYSNGAFSPASITVDTLSTVLYAVWSQNATPSNSPANNAPARVSAPARMSSGSGGAQTNTGSDQEGTDVSVNGAGSEFTTPQGRMKERSAVDEDLLVQDDSTLAKNLLVASTLTVTVVTPIIIVVARKKKKEEEEM